MIRMNALAALRKRRRAGPTALATALAYLHVLAYPITAAAQERESSEAFADHREGDATQVSSPVSARASQQDAGARGPREEEGDHGVEALKGANSAAPSMAHAMAAGTPSAGGGQGSGLSLPSGAGTTQGMGESFSAQLSTGIATYGLAIDLPAARGGVQPQLALNYSSAGGSGVVGTGWSIGVPYIARQTGHTPPRYQDPPTGGGWTPAQDSLAFNGAEIVPICIVENGGACNGKLPDEVMPAWAAGWQYFRTRIEGSFLRFFWSPDHLTFRVQDKNGTSMELGVPLDGSGDRNALETDGGSRVFRWNIARAYDTAGETNAAAQAQPRPSNVIVYRYLHDGGIAYPSDLFDTPPAANPAAPLSEYAHHAHLDWSPRPDVLRNFRRGWDVRQGLRLARIDVTSKPFANAVSFPRRQLRRYRLGYDPNYHVSLLTTVQQEGRCVALEDAAPAEGADGILPASSCATLPPVTLSYSHVQRSDGTPAPSDIPGFEGFDDTLRSITNSPPAGLDNGFVDFYDVNADALPDVLDTQAVLHQGRHVVYLQGASGVSDTFGAVTPMTVSPTSGIDSATLSFSNPNVLPLDLDGDGISNLVHVVPHQTPVIFKPAPSGTAFTWVGREAARNTALDPIVDFSNQREQVRTVDANNDGLVDFVVSGTSQLRTFFSLGRLPGGDGRFGSGTWTGSATAQLSAAPMTACIPFSGEPVFFDQSDVKLAEVNGDGLVDIVRVRNGSVIYWPGRGDGTWGTGDLSNCHDGFLGEDRLISMGNSPVLPGGDDNPIQMGDVNGDGLADIEYVAHGGVTVWLNVDGVSWTGAHFISTPPVAQFQARILDLNGSGTPDVVWADAYHYRYIDLLGGQRPSLLTRIENGFGKSTTLEYSTSTAEMLTATATGRPWVQTVPNVVHVIKRITVRDNLERVGRPAGIYVTEYGYRDPVYDGRQREFRGFRTATERKLGDANSPSSTVQSTFLLGECAEEGLPGRCADEARWRDNPREALKGLSVVSEVFDDGGVYFSTAHTTYRLRHLYTGLDGREVRYAFASRADTYIYDTASFVAEASSIPVVDVELELAQPQPDGSPTGSGVGQDTSRALTLRATAGRVQTEREWWADAYGNSTRSRHDGCVQGCGPADEAITQVVVPTRVPSDGSGWLWRTADTYVVGSTAPTERRHHIALSFDTFGRAVSSAAELQGTLLLDRFHESGAAVAPAPTSASSDGVIGLGTSTYSAVGNVVKSTGPGGRCSVTEYDDAYAQFIVKQTTFVGALQSDCGSVPLVTAADYDRGFGKLSTLTGPNGEQQRASIDSFGRNLALFRTDPSTGTAQSTPTISYEYDLPSDSHARPYTRIRTVAQVGTAAAPRTHERWEWIDGLGRTLVGLSQADPTAGDGGDWIVGGFPAYDAKGALSGAYRPWFWSGPPPSFPLGTSPPTSLIRQRYDAFGRIAQTYAYDGSLRLRTRYHALSKDLWDAADVGQGPRSGTYTTIAEDGHGRIHVSTERLHVGGALEAHEVRTEYLPSGEPTTITRVRAGAQDSPVVRWMRYDTMGRLVLNVDPNTTHNFVADPSADPTTFKAWRYAYDDVGQMVGTSDPRGCGENYVYDAGGRLVAEDYSPCRGNHAAYSPLDLATGDGAEAFFVYDTAPSSIAGSESACGSTTSGGFRLGRLAASFSRAEVSVPFYDALGRATCSARKLAKPNNDIPTLSARYAPRWYATQATFDNADRPIAITTGARSSELLGLSGESIVSIEYSTRGMTKSVGGSYGALIAKSISDAEGHPLEIVYGDIATTTTDFTYDQRIRVQNVQTYRGPPSIWTSPTGSYQPPPGTAPSTLQKVLEDRTIVYDNADNPIEIRDDRVADEWPSGAKPVTQIIQYDDLYRVTSVKYASGDDTWTPPFQVETQTTDRTRPMPFATFGSRVKEQHFVYDWLGNIVTSGDDVSGFYDRSLGAASHGTANAGPYQLKHATNRASPGGYPGDLDAAYDDGGNLVTLIIQRDGACMPAGASCVQRFSYEWDEVGRLVHAWRWDLSASERAGEASFLAGAPPSRTPDATLHFGYDDAGGRVRKTSVDARGVERHALYIFPSLELRRAEWTDGDYKLDATTEVPFLFSGSSRIGRIVYAEASAPSVSGSRQHVFLELAQTLGSTGVVIDRDTSELVEAVTYQAYGAPESDYRPGRWDSFREDYRFTGKEDDIELGLTYFGQRYYAPALGRWISPDPLAIHDLKADPNLYAYVHGRTFASVDPNGTCEVICLMIITVAVSAAIGATTSVIAQATTGDGHVDLGIVAIAAGAGAVGGLAGFGAGIGIAAGVTAAFGTAAASSTVGGFVIGAGSGAVSGLTSGATARGLEGAYRGRADPLGDAFNPDAMAGDALMGAGMGGATSVLSGMVTSALNNSAQAGASRAALRVRTGIRAGSGEGIGGGGSELPPGGIGSGGGPVPAAPEPVPAEVPSVRSAEPPTPVAQAEAAATPQTTPSAAPKGIARSGGTHVPKPSPYAGMSSEARMGVMAEHVAKARDVIAGLPGKLFKPLQCTNCTKAMVEALTKEGIPGEVLTIQAPKGVDQIASDLLPGTNLTRNGMHQAVKVGNTVFDNFFKGGVPYDTYMNALHARGGYSVTPTRF